MSKLQKNMATAKHTSALSSTLLAEVKSRIVLVREEEASDLRSKILTTKSNSVGKEYKQ